MVAAMEMERAHGLAQQPRLGPPRRVVGSAETACHSNMPPGELQWQAAAERAQSLGQCYQRSCGYKIEPGAAL